MCQGWVLSPESWVSLARSMPFISYISRVRFTGPLSLCDYSLLRSPPYRTRAPTSPLDSFILGDCPMSWLEPRFLCQLLGIDCHCQVCLAAAPCGILDSLDSVHGSGQVPVTQPLWTLSGALAAAHALWIQSRFASSPSPLAFSTEVSEYFKKELLPSIPCLSHLTICYFCLALTLNGAQ